MGFESYYLSFVLSLAPFASSRRRRCRCSSKNHVLFLIGGKNFTTKFDYKTTWYKTKIKCEGLWLIAICYKVMLLILFFPFFCSCLFVCVYSKLVYYMFIFSYVQMKKQQKFFFYCFWCYCSLLHSQFKTKEHTQAQLTNVHVNTQLCVCATQRNWRSELWFERLIQSGWCFFSSFLVQALFASLNCIRKVAWREAGIHSAMSMRCKEHPPVSMSYKQQEKVREIEEEREKEDNFLQPFLSCFTSTSISMFFFGYIL